MIEWAKTGREILDQSSNLPPGERALMEAYIRVVELTAGVPVEVKRFDPEARVGLEEIGYSFVWAIQAKSLAQLIAEGVIPDNYVNSSARLRAVVPVAREVAINPGLVVLDGSNNLSRDDQVAKTEEHESKLRETSLKRGNLDTVSFNLTNASVYVQLDRAFERQTGKPLYTPKRGEYGLWVRTIDDTDPGRVAGVGRGAGAPRLVVDDWLRGYGSPDLWAAPVAEPK